MRKFSKVYENKLDNNDIKNILIDLYDNGCEVVIKDVFMLDNELYTDLHDVTLDARYAKWISIDPNLKDERIGVFKIKDGRINSSPLNFMDDFDKFNTIIQALSNYVDYFENFDKKFTIYNEVIYLLLVGQKVSGEDHEKVKSLHEYRGPILDKVISLGSSIGLKFTTDGGRVMFASRNLYWSFFEYLNTGSSQPGDIQKKDMQTLKSKGIENLTIELRNKNIRVTGIEDSWSRNEYHLKLEFIK